MVNPGRVVGILLALWFFVAILLGASGRFRAASAPSVAMTVWGLSVFALLACWLVPPFRKWASTVDLNWLVRFHLIRLVAAILFLIDCRAGILSPAFALPAAYGDMAVAILALLFLIVPAINRSRRLLFVWNSLGLIDIVFVVITALRVGLRDWPAMAPLRDLPLMLLPTFVVPLVIASHVLIFFRLARRDSIAAI